jgi:hypothetical protein
MSQKPFTAIPIHAAKANWSEKLYKAPHKFYSNEYLRFI